ncbi:MAG: serine O-acetyltransferase EpsC [Chitinophagales bacterium]
MKNLIDKIQSYNAVYMAKLPATSDIEQFVDSLIDFLFPMRLGASSARMSTLADVELLEEKFLTLITSVVDEDKRLPLSQDFFSKLESIFENLHLDAAAILEFDPAANSLLEVVSAYPGFYAVAVYRIASEMEQLKLPYIPRLMSELAHSKTGIDINPRARIGESFFIDHGTGVVIGETTVIGKQVKLYQGVTLGALQVSKELANTKRHPTIEDGVIIYSGATILGGETIIGSNSVIGGNVWLTESVPSNSIVFTQHETKIRDKKEYVQAIDFVI